MLAGCYFQTSMSTQRLDFLCSFSHKDTSRSKSIRPIESNTTGGGGGGSIKQNIRLPTLTTRTSQNQFEGRRRIREQQQGLKRFAEQGSIDESVAKRKKSSCCGDDDDDDDGYENLSLGQLGAGNFWCFTGHNAVPSEVVSSVSSPLSPSNNPWIDSVITKIADFSEKDVELETIHMHRPEKEASGSSTSSESRHSLGGLRLNKQATELEEEDNNYAEQQGFEEDNNNHAEQQGFELLHSLAACVEAIGSKNIAAIDHWLAKLGDLASPRGNVISRLTAYYTEALALRVTRLWPNIFHLTTPRELDRMEDDSGAALRLLNQLTPIPKFVHFTSNEMLLRALEGKDKVHIIDFDIKQGLQWPSLFQSLASRTNPPSHVRVTGIGECKQELNETGDRLAGFAEALGLPFEFHQVVDKLEDVRLWMLHVNGKESVAVNCAFQLHKTLYDRSGGASRDFLGLVHSTNPLVVTVTP